MLTENEARDLLTRAAGTIEPSPGEPVTRAPRRVWPVLAAAAAVLAVVGVTSAVIGGPGDSPRPDTGPTTPTGSVLAPDQIPSVFAYDGAGARRLLVELGLRVTIRPDHTCQTSGRATHTDPAVGTRFEPGDQVTLFVTAIDPAVRCAPPRDTLAWQFLDFANGRGPAPAFADNVTLYVDGRRTATLTATEAADIANWGEPSAITEAREQTAVVTRINSTWVAPSLFVRIRKPSDQLAPPPAAVAGRSAVSVRVNVPTDGPDPGLSVDLYRAEGRIDTVVLTTDAGPANHETATVPSVVGISNPDPGGVGDRFVRFALGQRDSAPVAATVGLYVGNELVKTISREEAADPAAWQVCPAGGSYAARSCPFSALTPLRQSGAVDFSAEPPQGPCLPESQLRVIGPHDRTPDTHQRPAVLTSRRY